MAFGSKKKYQVTFIYYSKNTGNMLRIGGYFPEFLDVFPGRDQAVDIYLLEG